MKKLVICMLLLATVSGLWGCASMVDRRLNKTTLSPPYKAGSKAAALHRTLHVVDLHADPLLWPRDLLVRNRTGHVDLPRLQQGHVALQVFGVVTAAPYPLRLENNADDRDLIAPLAYLQDWPSATWSSRLQRALFQAKKLSNYIGASNGALRLIKTRQDVLDLIHARNQGQTVIGAMLSLEGVHALEGNPKT